MCFGKHPPWRLGTHNLGRRLAAPLVHPLRLAIAILFHFRVDTPLLGIFPPSQNDHRGRNIPQLWLDGFQGRGLAVDKIFDGYKSVADWPVADFYKARSCSQASRFSTWRNPSPGSAAAASGALTAVVMLQASGCVYPLELFAVTVAVGRQVFLRVIFGTRISGVRSNKTGSRVALL